MIYIFTILLIFGAYKILVAPYAQTNIYDSRRKLYHIVVALWFILLMILRHDYVGTDTQNYRKIYEYLQYWDFDPSVRSATITSEFGFYYLNFTLAKLGCDFRVLLTLCAMLYVGSISYLIYKYSEKPWLSYYLFLTLGYFIFATTMRQCFALSFSIIALQLAINRKLIPYCFFVLLAISFHSTAIVFLPVYWIIHLSLKKRTAILMGLCCLTTILFFRSIYSYALEFTGKEYVNAETSGYLVLFFSVLLVITGCLVIEKMPPSNKYWLLLLSLVLCWMPIASMNPALFRINLYFSVYMIIFVVNMVNYIPATYRQLFVLCLFLIGVYQFAYKTPRSGIRNIPYVFYWEDYFEKNPDARNLNLQ